MCRTIFAFDIAIGRRDRLRAKLGTKVRYWHATHDSVYLPMLVAADKCPSTELREELLLQKWNSKSATETYMSYMN